MSLAGNLSRRLELDKMFVTVGEEVVFVGQRDGFWNEGVNEDWLFGIPSLESSLAGHLASEATSGLATHHGKPASCFGKRHTCKTTASSIPS